MLEPDTPSPAVPRSDEDRTASFEELMRLERRQNRPPISGLAVASLGFAALFTLAAYFYGVFSLVVGAAAFVFGLFALPQIRHRERRGLVFVFAAVVVLACGVVVVESAMDRLAG
jgi:hypothetical protein